MTDLNKLKEVCDVYIGLDDRVKACEAELKTAKEDFNRLRLDVLPEMFFELELSELKLRSGEKIIVNSDLTAAIKPKDKAAAHAWLNEHGFGGIIKTQVSVAFDKGQHDEAEELWSELAPKFSAVNFDEKVHPGTLRSFIKEQLAEGHEVPMELFGVFPFNVAKLERK